MASPQGFFKWLRGKAVKWQKVVPPFGSCVPTTSHVYDFCGKSVYFFLTSDAALDF